MASQGDPIHSEKHLRTVCVGFGASGLCLAYKLQRSFVNYSFVAYEKNSEVSGTCVACDVPAHNYVWSFAPKADWSSIYAPAKEIYTYFNDFMFNNGLGRFCKTNQKVIGARWDEARGKWDIEIEDLSSGLTIFDVCDVLVNASGVLNNWRWPAIPGIKSYNGKMVHSANWDETLDLTGKHVGLIGNGSSGIQILPAIQPSVSKLTTFICEATWIAPPFDMDQRFYTEQEKQEFSMNESRLLELRKANETNMNQMFGIFMKESQEQKSTKQSFSRQMEEKLKDIPWLKKKVIPEWPVGCRRITPGIGYLEALSKPNVKVVYGEIESITEAGCRCDDGNEYPVDVLICATGFDTSFKPRFPIVRLQGRNLQEEWAKEPRSYLGLAAPHMPNYFQFMGPNCPIGNGPLLIAIEAQTDYMLAFCDKWQTEGIASFSPKDQAVTEFLAYCDQYLSKTVWSEECRSWYKNNSTSGRVSALWPGSTLHYLEALREPRFEDWEFISSGNRFAFFGSGFSQAELDPYADLGYYVRNGDDGPYASKRKRREALTHTGYDFKKGFEENYRSHVDTEPSVAAESVADGRFVSARTTKL